MKTNPLEMKKVVFVMTIILFVQGSSISNCQWSKIDSHNITRCTICMPSFASNLNYTQCNQCSSVHESCLRCQGVNGQLSCQLCDFGYQVVNGTCWRMASCNDQNCLVCSNNVSQCGYCKNGYFLNKTTFACTACPFPDQFDSFNQTCICDRDQYLQITNGSPKSCFKCTFPCQSCSQTDTNCTKCIYGFFMATPGNCSLCLTPNCIICLKADICVACTLGYKLANGTCRIQLQTQNIDNYINLPEFYYFCQIGCFYCYKYDFCLTCLQGYSRNLYNDSCMFCGQGCKRCESLLQMKCFSCYEGYRLTNFTCQQCQDQNCLHCNVSQILCNKCREGFTEVNGSCQPCAKNCLKCDKQGAFKCDINSCINGYARVDISQCAACALGCYSCSPVDVSACISCPIGSFQVQGGQCQVCPSSCIECTSVQNCLSCRQNYRLVNKICYQSCTYPCLECSLFNKKICSSCFKGYVLSQNYTCVADLGCNNGRNCTICPVGYFLTPTDSVCHSCQLQQNCIKCQTQSSKCVICKPGYYVIENQCQLCSSNCVKCQLFDRCFQCKDGHYLHKQDRYDVYGKCLPCSSNCLTCIDERNKCNSCGLGKTLIGFGCITSRNIIFKITMKHQSISEQNAQIISFIKEIVPFTQYVASTIGEPYASNPDMLHIKDITSGSIQVVYMASVGNLDPRMLLKTVTDRIKNIENFKQFSILRTEIVANGFQSDTTVSPPQYYLYVSLVPAPFFVFFTILVLYQFVKSKSKMNEEQSETDKSHKQSSGKEIVLEPMDSTKNLKENGQGPITM